MRTDFATAIQWTKTEEKFFCFSMLNINFLSLHLLSSTISIRYSSMRRLAKMYVYIYFSDRVEWKRKTRRVEAVTSVAGDDDGDFFIPIKMMSTH